MNLHDAGIKYLTVPETVMRLCTRTAFLTALQIYSTAGLRLKTPLPNLTPYQVRQRNDITSELVRAGVLQETEYGLERVPVDMKKDPTLAKSIIVLPSLVEFDALGINALKVMLTLWLLNRYSRTSFVLMLTQSELAQHAGIGERQVGDAVKQLVDHRVVEVKKQWKAASRYTLLDPESGVGLFFLAEFYRKRMDTTGVHDRYKTILAPFDPRGQLKDIRLGVSGYNVHCPYCAKRGREPTLRFNSAEGEDHWHCFNCRRGGDSARLWARWEPWIGRTDWRVMMAASCPQTGELTRPTYTEPEFEMEEAC